MNAEWSDLAERTEAIVMERFDAETPEHPNPSQHSMRAAGLSEVHVRRNWVYRRRAG